MGSDSFPSFSQSQSRASIEPTQSGSGSTWPAIRSLDRFMMASKTASRSLIRPGVGPYLPEQLKDASAPLHRGVEDEADLRRMPKADPPADLRPDETARPFEGLH